MFGLALWESAASRRGTIGGSARSRRIALPSTEDADWLLGAMIQTSR